MFIPKENEKDLAEIPDNVKKHLKLVPVAHVDEVIAQALVRKPEPIEWVEPPESAGRGTLPPEPFAGIAAALITRADASAACPASSGRAVFRPAL